MSETFERYLEMYKKISEATTQLNVNYQEIKLLIILQTIKAHSKEMGLNFTEISDIADDTFSQSSYSQLVKKLRKEGYVSKEMDNQDERCRCIYLTPRGIETCEKLEKILKC